MKVVISKSDRSGKKYKAVFTDRDTQKTIHFGSSLYEDMTQHKDPERRLNYLARHKAREDWSDPMTAGSLSRWILWETPSLQENIRIFKRKFNLK